MNTFTKTSLKRSQNVSTILAMNVFVHTAHHIHHHTPMMFFCASGGQ